MPTNKQRREAARRHLERQLQRREEREAARKRFTLIASIVGTIVLIAVVAIFVVAVGHDNKKTKTTPAAFVPKKTSGPCGYTTVDPSRDPSSKNVGLPPDPDHTPTDTLTVDFATNRGTIEVALDGKNAPCTVQSMAYLIQKKFYDNTPCPRTSDSGLYIVQCGSGTDTTAGGPTYFVPDENVAKADYSAGAIAIANSGQPNSGGSQFFFLVKDSNAALQKSYTVAGHVTKGLDILQKVVAGGNDGSSPAGGGTPKLPLVFKTVKIVKVSGGSQAPGTGPPPTLVPVG